MIQKNPMIRLEGFRKEYGSIQAVRGIDLEVAKGETLALLGPNGGGKTTVLRAVAGLHSPSGGRVWIDGLDVEKEPDRVKQRTSYLPQRAMMPGLLSAREVLELFARLRQVPLDRVEEVLELFVLGDDADRFTREYSGGMLQRLGLAVTFLEEVSLYILDEPTLNLDSLGIQRLRDHLQLLKNNGATVLFSSHNLHDTMQTADRVAVLVEGQVVKVEDVSVFRNTVTREMKVRVVLTSTTDAILEAARAAGADITDRNGRHVHFRALPDRRLGVVRAIEEAGGTIEEFHTEAPDWDALVRPHFQPRGNGEPES
jgi:ABC-type multidrug transport system ATPase subunit